MSRAFDLCYSDMADQRREGTARDGGRVEREGRRKQVEGGAEGWRNAYFKGLLQVISMGKDYERNLRQVSTGSHLLHFHKHSRHPNTCSALLWLVCVSCT